MIWVVFYIFIGVIVSFLQYQSEKKLFGEYARRIQPTLPGLLGMGAVVVVIWPIAAVGLILIAIYPEKAKELARRK